MSLATVLLVIIIQIAAIVTISVLPRTPRLRARMIHRLLGLGTVVGLILAYGQAGLSDLQGHRAPSLIPFGIIFVGNALSWAVAHDHYQRMYGNPRTR